MKFSGHTKYSGQALRFASILGLVLTTLIAAASVATAATYKILPPKATGVTSELARSFAELIRLEIFKTSTNQVSDNANFSLQPSIIKFGESFVIGLEKLKLGKLLASESLKINTQDELDVGVKRLVRAILLGKHAEDNEHVGDVTSQEIDETRNRKQSVNRFLVSVGPASSTGIGGGKDLLMSFDLGYSFEYKNLAPKFFLQGANSYGKTEVGEFHICLGLEYFFSAGSKTPLVGVDLGYGSVRTNLDAGGGDGSKLALDGFSVGFNAGYMLLRTSSVAMVAQGFVRPVLSTVQGHLAGVFGAQIGLRFQ